MIFEASIFDQIFFPASWKKYRLREVFENRKSFTKEELPILGANVSLGVTERFDGDGRPAASEDLSKYKVVEPNDIIMNPLGKPHGSIGMSTKKGITSPAYWVLICKGEIDPKFMHHMLRSEIMLNEFRRRSKNLPPNQFDLPWEQFRDIEISIPSLELQLTIVEFLDNQIQRLDETVLNNHRKKELLRNLMASKLSEIVLKPTIDSIPIKRLIKEERLGIWGDEEGINDTSVFVARVADFNRNSFKLGIVETVRSIEFKQFVDRKVNKGDILLERSGGGEKSPVGCAVYVSLDLPNLVCSNFVSRIKPQERIDSKYLGYIFASLYLSDRQRPFSNQTTGIQNLDTEAYFKFEVPIRTEIEQKQIVEECEKIVESTAISISLIEQLIHTIEKYKESQIVNSLIGNNLAELMQEVANG